MPQMQTVEDCEGPSGVYRDCKWKIIPQFGSYCGYARLPRSHPFNKFEDPMIPNYDDMDIDVHGGLTYSGKSSDKDYFWIGFDCLHFDDKSNYGFGHSGHEWTHDEVLAEIKKMIDQCVEADK